jgi:hypothetical protein
MFKAMQRACVGVLLLLAAAGWVHAEKLSPKALEAARVHGKARVLVMLRDTPDGAAETRNHGQWRRQQVAGKVDSVMKRLPANGYSMHRRFALVPAMAIEANAATLLELRDDPDVVRIDLDQPGSGNSIAPDAASVLNNVSPLQGLGFGGAGMKVAVIDSGVDTDHIDLKTQLIGQQCFCSNVDGIGGCCPNAQATQGGAGAAEDDNGHGTNVSGIIVGQGSAAPRGAVPDAQLVVVKVLDRNNQFCCSSDVVAAMDWLAANHPDVDVVNMSLGTSALFAGDCDNASSFTQAMAAAVDALVARGAVVTVSTGNDHNSSMVEAPACVRNAVGVGATWDFSGGAAVFLGCTDASTAPKQPACFANRSTTTDLYAAGAYVTATGFTGSTSTYGGTSQAAPMVAACAAALKQAAPASTVDQRVEAMRLAPTRVTDPVSGRSYPFLDCVDALRLLAPKRRAIADFDGDGRSDVPWRNRNTGANALWKSANATTVQAITTVTNLAWKIVGAGDFDGDRKADLLWRQDTSGANAIWRSGNSATALATATVGNVAWKVAGVGDFDGDGRGDILWRHATTGSNTIWKSGNATTVQAATAVTDVAWKVAGVGDFDGDGRDDILWRHATTGNNAIWKSGSSTTPQSVARMSDLAWQVAGVGDFDGDGHADILWRNTRTGGNTYWKAGSATNQVGVTGVTGTAWKVAATGDYNGDGRADVLWRNESTGANALWLSASSTNLQAVAGSSVAWEIKP